MSDVFGSLRSAVPVKASVRERHLNLYLWWLLLVTNVVDVLVSRRAFESGLRELNPIVEVLYVDYGMYGVALFKAVWIFILLKLLPYIRSWTQMLFALASLVYFALAVLHISNLSPLL